MSKHSWKVVPISSGQMQDVRPEDVLENGLYRKCSTYRGGGGYDQFPYLAAKRFGGHPDQYSSQFIVQLRGCNLDCHYCYVTREGVWGEPTKVTTEELVDAFVRSGQPVFHLMGGAPALQLPWWGKLIEELFNRCPEAIFHSDLMLSERLYTSNSLEGIAQDRCLYAIDIKGLTKEDWLQNTRKPLAEDLFWYNWSMLQLNVVPAYVTFTGVDTKSVEAFWGLVQHHGIDPAWRDEAFVIDLIGYDAAPYVDAVPWGGR